MLSVTGLQKSQTSKVINACFSFSGISLNHSMVSLVHFHRFTLVACAISWFIRSRMFLLHDDANFGFAWINESAGQVIYEIRFVVF